MIRFLDTFSGIGGFRVAATQAATLVKTPHSFVASVEINAKARAIYQKNFGDTPLHDITKIDPATLPDFDIILGGFPCPVFSRNGKYFNKGKVAPQNDDRTDLFKNLVDILRVKKPAGFVFENVKEISTILHYSGKIMKDHVQDSIQELGYSVVCQTYDSKDFGLAQQRKRVYFYGFKDGTYPFEFVNNPDDKAYVMDVMDEDADPKLLLTNAWAKRKGGSPLALAEKIEKSLGQYALPKLVKAFKSAGDRVVSRLELLSLASKSGQWPEPMQTASVVWPLAVLYGMTPSAGPRQQDKVYSRKGISPTLATFSTPAFDHPKGWRILSPRECARLQGFPDSFILPSSKADAYRMIGNAVSVGVAKHVIAFMLRSILDC